MGSFIYDTPTWQIALTIMLGMIMAIYVGWKLSRKRIRLIGKEAGASNSLITALFGLSGFLLGFTFSISANRFDQRRHFMVEEANAIGTAWMRKDLYPDSIQTKMDPKFKAYAESRVLYYKSRNSEKEVLIKEFNNSNKIGKEIWGIAVNYSRQSNNMLPSNQMLPALNAMLDSASSSRQSFLAIVPESIVAMLFLLTITTSFLAGYSAKEGSLDWTVTIGFSVITALVIFITLDLDRPKRGLINLNEQTRMFQELYEEMIR